MLLTFESCFAGLCPRYLVSLLREAHVGVIYFIIFGHRELIAIVQVNLWSGAVGSTSHDPFCTDHYYPIATARFAQPVISLDEFRVKGANTPIGPVELNFGVVFLAVAGNFN